MDGRSNGGRGKGKKMKARKKAAAKKQQGNANAQKKVVAESTKKPTQMVATGHNSVSNSTAPVAPASSFHGRTNPPKKRQKNSIQQQQQPSADAATAILNKQAAENATGKKLLASVNTSNVATIPAAPQPPQQPVTAIAMRRESVELQSKLVLSTSKRKRKKKKDKPAETTKSVQELPRQEVSVEENIVPIPPQPATQTSSEHKEKQTVSAKRKLSHIDSEPSKSSEPQEKVLKMVAPSLQPAENDQPLAKKPKPSDVTISDEQKLPTQNQPKLDTVHPPPVTTATTESNSIVTPPESVPKVVEARAAPSVFDEETCPVQDVSKLQAQTSLSLTTKTTLKVAEAPTLSSNEQPPSELPQVSPKGNVRVAGSDVTTSYEKSDSVPIASPAHQDLVVAKPTNKAPSTTSNMVCSVITTTTHSRATAEPACNNASSDGIEVIQKQHGSVRTASPSPATKIEKRLFTDVLDEETKESKLQVVAKPSCDSITGSSSGQIANVASAIVSPANRKHKLVHQSGHSIPEPQSKQQDDIAAFGKLRGIPVDVGSRESYVEKLLKATESMQPSTSTSIQKVPQEPLKNAWGPSFGMTEMVVKESSSPGLLLSTTPLSSWFLSKGAANFMKKVSFPKENDHSRQKLQLALGTEYTSDKSGKRARATTPRAKGVNSSQNCTKQNAFLESLAAQSQWRSWYGKLDEKDLLDPPLVRVPAKLLSQVQTEEVNDISECEDVIQRAIETAAGETKKSEIDVLEEEIRTERERGKAFEEQLLRILQGQTLSGKSLEEEYRAVLQRS